MIMDRRLGPDYNCAHFAVEVCDDLGFDIRPALAGFLHPRRSRRALPSARTGLQRVSSPVDPCLVLLRRAKATPHVGVFVHGRLFHLTDSGPIRQLLSVARIGYTSVRFYALR